MNRFAIVYDNEDGTEQFPFMNDKNQYHIYDTRQDAVKMMSVIVQAIEGKIAGNPKIIPGVFQQRSVQTTFPTAEEIARWQYKLATMDIVEVTITRAKSDLMC